MLESRLMRSISARAWALVLLSGALQIAIFPIAGPLPVWRAVLAWAALAPLLAALSFSQRDGKTLSLANSALLGYLCGFIWYMGNCGWIYQTMHLYGGLPLPVSFLILILFSLYLGLYHAIFTFIFALLRRSQGSVRAAVVLSPFAWVAVELARARITSFPWDLLGYSQIDHSFLTALAPVAGVMSMSFVVAAGNATVVLLYLRRPRRALSMVGVAVALVFLGAGYLRMPVTAVSYPEKAVMMQENIEVGAVGREVPLLTVGEEVAQFTKWSMHPNYSSSRDREWIEGPHQRVTVVIWPEAPSHLVSSDPFFQSAAGALAHREGAPLIAGSIGLDRDAAAQRGFLEYDSASLFDAAGTYRARYDKIHLVPWGEYVPYKQFFRFADKLTEGVGNMDRGQARTVFATGGHTYGVFICYESIFGDEVREFVKNGAEVLVNISDDGWYGDSGAPWQHLNMARMRAIENNRWVLRSTNTGITTAIAPDGTMAAQAPRHIRAAFVFPFAFTQGATFYTRHGDWFAWLCVAFTLAGLLFRRVRKSELR